MKRIIFINGSPRGKQSGSQFFIEQVQSLLDNAQTQTETVCIAKQAVSTDDLLFQKMLDADCLVFAFPLYVDSLPAGLLDFLDRFSRYDASRQVNSSNRKPIVYAIVNCGFHKAWNNVTALQIMKNFSRRLGCAWGFGIGIGGGEFCKEKSTNALYRWFKKPVFSALSKLAKEFTSPPGIARKNIYATTRMPTRLFNFVANKRWLKKLNKNGIMEDWDVRPYEDS